MSHRRAGWSAVAVAGVLVAGLSGCGQAPDPAGTRGPSAALPVAMPDPIPTVEPHCIADYQWFATAVDLVSHADLVVRVTATGPSRDYDLRPDRPFSDDPATSPQAGMSPEELAEIPPLPATAITVRVDDVLKGDVAVGDVFEVNQSMCTARPLPVGPEADYVLALSVFDVGDPLSQLNDGQAAWQVAGDRSLVPVNPEDDLGVGTLDELAAAVAVADLRDAG